MATVQLSQRPLLVLAGAVVLHIILISAQVSTTAGIPFIQVVTFGAFAEVQRGTMNSFDSVRGRVDRLLSRLRDAQTENESAEARAADAAGAVAGGARPSAAHREPSSAAGAAQARRARDRGLRDDRRPATPEFRDMTIDKGGVRRCRTGHGRHLAGRCRRPRHPAEPARVARADADRPQRRRGRDDRAHARAGHRRRPGRFAADGVRAGHGRRQVRATSSSRQASTRSIRRDFVIGTVEVVNRGQGTFHEITVRPAVDFSRLEEVLVVTTPPPAITAEQIAAEAAKLAAAAPPAPPAAPAAPQNVSPGVHSRATRRRARRRRDHRRRAIRRLARLLASRHRPGTERRRPPQPRRVTAHHRARRKSKGPEVKAASALAAIAVALALQTTLASLVIRGTAALDLVLIVVVYLSLISGPVADCCSAARPAWSRTPCRAESSGLAGWPRPSWDSWPAFSAPSSSSRRRCRDFSSSCMTTVLHAAIFMGLYMLLDLRQFDAPYTAVLSQALGNGFLGVVGGAAGRAPAGPARAATRSARRPPLEVDACDWRVAERAKPPRRSIDVNW